MKTDNDPSPVTAYLVATFTRIGPFYFVTRVSMHSEDEPTMPERIGEHQFTCVLNSDSATSFDVALKNLQRKQREYKDLTRMRLHLDRFQGTIKRGLSTFASSAWVTKWRRSYDDNVS